MLKNTRLQFEAIVWIPVIGPGLAQQTIKLLLPCLPGAGMQAEEDKWQRKAARNLHGVINRTRSVLLSTYRRLCFALQVED